MVYGYREDPGSGFPSFQKAKRTFTSARWRSGCRSNQFFPEDDRMGSYMERRHTQRGRLSSQSHSAEAQTLALKVIP
eukprot:s3864_g2.t1